MKSLPLTARQLRATEALLQRIYDAAKLGLKGDTLALAAGMLPEEYQRLRQMDRVAEMAELKGRADGEMQASAQLHSAAASGDAKAALEILKHAHGWVAKQQVQIDVAQQISITAALEQAQRRVGALENVEDVQPLCDNRPRMLEDASWPTEKTRSHHEQSTHLSTPIADT